MDDTDTGNKLQATLDKVSADVPASFRRNGITSDALPVQHSGKRDVITETDIAQMMAVVEMSHPGLTADQLGAIRKTLEGMAGTRSRADMQQTAEEAARTFGNANEQQAQNQTPQQHLHALWSDYAKRDKENTDEFEKLYHSGKITQEQMEYLRNERARLDALSEESEERIAGEKAYVEYQHVLGVRVRDNAHANGETDAEQSAAKLVQNTVEQKRELEEIHTLYANTEGKHLAKTQTDSVKTDVVLKDDEQVPTPTPSKMEVADVTHNDVQAPGGAKERTSDKSFKP